MTKYLKLTAINEGRDRLYFANVESLISKLLAIIININLRFIDVLCRYHSS